ncbi:MAG TPA: hypothetical protein VHZ31_05580 [Solirubrobacteraceae bacterium]|jgi:hypothetical protein|nr:hypothetical protein [Solirubrobacteraceae bacterium]
MSDWDDERPDAYRFLFTIQHARVEQESEELLQAVYDALGALDAACPSAIATIAEGDLDSVVRAGERSLTGEGSWPQELQQLRQATRRLRLVLGEA